MKKQDFTVLKIVDLHPFPDNPFRVVEDEMLMELAESIKEFGMVTPIITRPMEDGNGYEVIAGQRRVRACESEGVASSLSIVTSRFSCSSFFRKDSSAAGVRAIFPSSTICKIGGISSVRRINLCIWVRLLGDFWASCSTEVNFCPSWGEVKSVRKPCRFIASSFIL